MRVLLASDRLAVPGGSETYLFTLGRQLQRFGHEVFTVEGPDGDGGLSEHYGLRALRRPSDLAEAPDRVVVQDAVVAGEVAAAWPDVPQVAVVHSSLHDLQLPANLPTTVAAFVALNDRLARRAEVLAEGRPVHRLTQPVDVGHFTIGPPPASRPRRVLLFGNNTAPWRTAALLAECEARGIEAERVGASAGKLVLDPLLHLRRADVVVGYGRCILEAMACGRTAFVFDRFGSDGWVTGSTYPEIEATGFCGVTDLDEPGRDDFAEVFDSYDPRTGAVGHDLALRHHDARAHATSFLEILADLGPVEPADPATALALARTWREQWRWERQALAWAAEVDAMRASQDADAAALATAEARLGELRGQVDELRAALAATESARAAADDRIAALERSRAHRAAVALQRLLPSRRRPA